MHPQSPQVNSRIRTREQETSGSTYASEMVAGAMDADEFVQEPSTPRLEIQRRETRTPGTGSSWSLVDIASTMVTPPRRGGRGALTDGVQLPEEPPMPGGSNSSGTRLSGKGVGERAIVRGK